MVVGSERAPGAVTSSKDEKPSSWGASGAGAGGGRAGSVGAALPNVLPPKMVGNALKAELALGAAMGAPALDPKRPPVFDGNKCCGCPKKLWGCFCENSIGCCCWRPICWVGNPKADWPNVDSVVLFAPNSGPVVLLLEYILTAWRWGTHVAMVSDATVLRIRVASVQSSPRFESYLK